MKKRLYLIAIFFVILDQFIKIVITNTLTIGKSLVLIPQFFKLTYVENTGGAWSILNSNTLILTIISIIVFTILIIYLKKHNKYTKLEVITYAFLVSGVLGNLIDRIIRKAVIDYLDFNIFGYNFPIFNLADILIVIGVGIMILETILNERSEKHANRKYDNY